MTAAIGRIRSSSSDKTGKSSRPAADEAPTIEPFGAGTGKEILRDRELKPDSGGRRRASGRYKIGPAAERVAILKEQLSPMPPDAAKPPNS